MYVPEPTPRPFQVTTCLHGTPALEINDASKALHAYLSRLMRENRMDHEHYKLRMDAGAFFQGGSTEDEGWILIEFWNPDQAQKFVDYVNKHAKHL